jgi:hypothetical protein
MDAIPTANSCQEKFQIASLEKLLKASPRQRALQSAADALGKIGSAPGLFLIEAGRFSRAQAIKNLFRAPGP